MLYKVICIATHTETQEQMVIYQGLYGRHNIFARPYDMFASKVDKDKYPQAEQVFRFEECQTQRKKVIDCTDGKQFEYIEKLYLERDKIKEFDSYLTEVGLLGEKEKISYTVTFKNGYEMDINLYGGGDNDTAWTEACLYDNKNRQVSITEVCDRIVKEWVLYDNEGNCYNLEIKEL